MSVIILFVVGVIIVFLFFKGSVKCVNSSIEDRIEKAVNKAKDIDAKIAEMKNRIIIVNGSSIPGKRIIKAIGLVRGISDTKATTKEEFALIEKEALYNMLKEANNQGANAIIDIKLTTGTYEAQGNRQSSQAIYTGTAVVAE